MTLESPKFAPEPPPPFELKGSLFTLTVMHLREAGHHLIARHLQEKVRQAPAFFRNTPVVIDLEGLGERVDFGGLVELLRSQGMVPVGVRNGSSELRASAMQAGLAVLPESRPAAAKRAERDSPAPPRRSRMVTQPVRSGQQIYAPDGDLILLGTISPGAEVLADGNIHSYGPLRGRALAGVKGDTEARIFCLSLEAELVSIAGQYRVIEQLDAALRGRPVQIHLSADRLMIDPLYR